MNRRRLALLLVAALLLIVLPSSYYTVDETEQVIITQFGAPIGSAITTPGLKLKLPRPIWEVHRFDKRWLAWDGAANQITTKDKKFIWVDTYARWRIKDPLTYFESVHDENGAQSRLDDIIDGETRNAVAAFDLIEIVRSTNRDFDVTEEIEALVSEQRVDIVAGRDALAHAILEKSSEITPNFGIELVDVKFKHINYVEEVQAQVYERMITERQRIAERSRSEGQGRSAEVRGQKEKELNVIESEAFRTAEEIRGVADAEATSVYAGAYNKDPDFYQFMKTLETYRSSLNGDVTLILTSDSEFLSFLKSSGR